MNSELIRKRYHDTHVATGAASFARLGFTLQTREAQRKPDREVKRRSVGSVNLSEKPHIPCASRLALDSAQKQLLMRANLAPDSENRFYHSEV